MNMSTAGDQQLPDVACGPGGGFTVVWIDAQPSRRDTDVYARLFHPDGSPAGDEVWVNTDTRDYCWGPHVGRQRDGRAIVTWNRRGDDYDNQMYMQLVDTSSNLVLPYEFRVGGSSTQQQLVSDVAMAPNGNFVGVWETDSRDADSSEIRGALYGADVLPIDAIFGVNSYTASWQSNPSAAMDQDGNFIVAWHSNEQDGDGEGIYMQRFDATGARLGGERQVNSVTRRNQSTPAVAFSPGGQFVVAWREEFLGESGSGMRIQRFDASGAPDSAVLEIETPVQEMTISIAMMDDGRIAVAWTNGFVLVQRFDPAGTPLGSEPW